LGANGERVDVINMTLDQEGKGIGIKEKDKIEVLATWILESEKIVVFTGAGVSTESGIPDFRSPGGVWDRYDPNEFLYHKFLSSEETREKYWAFSMSLWPVITKAEPNPAHIAIEYLHRLGKLDCVITQNIDGLHQRAGVPDDKVIELHGTMRYVVCLDCGKRYKREEIQQRLEIQMQKGAKVPAPRCDDCNGILKPATVSFGQPMPEWETQEAQRRSAECDLFIVVGSSLVVYPAAQMPAIAKQSGTRTGAKARLVIINLTTTPHDELADMIIMEKAGDAMAKIISAVRKKKK
jgi:NAD-dependent deacetylase